MRRKFIETVRASTRGILVSLLIHDQKQTIRDVVTIAVHLQPVVGPWWLAIGLAVAFAVVLALVLAVRE